MMKEGKCIMGEMRKDREGKPYKADEDYKKLLEKAAKDSKSAWEKEHDAKQQAELETSLVKAVGMNSPEMRALQEKVKEAGRINKLHQELIEHLKAELSRAKEEHQYDNLVHAEELRKALEK